MQYQITDTKALQLRTQQPCQVLDHLFAPGASLPVSESDLLRATEVISKILGLACRKSCIEDIRVGLVIEAKRATIEIG